MKATMQPRRRLVAAALATLAAVLAGPAIGAGGPDISTAEIRAMWLPETRPHGDRQLNFLATNVSGRPVKSYSVECTLTRPGGIVTGTVVDLIRGIEPGEAAHGRLLIWGDNAAATGMRCRSRSR